MELFERVSTELRLPKAFRSAANGSTRLYKTILFKEAGLSQAQEKIVDELIDEILVFGIAGRSIPPFKNDERVYSEILFLFCRLKGWKAGIEELLLSSFEKPAILFTSVDSVEFTISTARKRFSLNESGRQISESFQKTHRLRLDSPTDMAYLRLLAIPNMPVSNLFLLHEAFSESLVEIDEGLRKDLDGWLGKKSRSIKKPEKYLDLIRQYCEVAREVQKLEAVHDQFRKDGEFGDALAAHTDITGKRRQMKRLLESVKKTFV
jgi:hypothetical protein